MCKKYEKGTSYPTYNSDDEDLPDENVSKGRSKRFIIKKLRPVPAFQDLLNGNEYHSEFAADDSEPEQMEEEQENQEDNEY